MQKTNINCSLEQSSHCKLFRKLCSIESKCERIMIELSEMKNLITSSASVGRLIESLENSANELYQQSVKQREYVERSMNGEATMRIVRRNDHEL